MKGKTERECVEAAVKRLEAAGYTAVDFTKQYQPGDKAMFVVHRKKAIIMTTFWPEAAEGGRAHQQRAHRLPASGFPKTESRFMKKTI
ncbi:MAG: hypothetical protein ACLUD2_10295 [Clostridium sp.]